MSTQMSTVHVAVVIPWFDDQPALDRLFVALAAQDFAGRLDVVVADDGSQHPPDLTAAAGLTVGSVSQPDEGFRAAAARNRGAEASEAALLLFVDADMVPEPGYVTEMVSGLSVFDVVVGRRRHADLTGWGPNEITAWFRGGPAPETLEEPQWLEDAYAGSADLAESDSRSYRYLISAVLGIRRNLFDSVGGFNEGFVGYGGEDWELAHRCWLAGARWRYLPEAVAWHAGVDFAERGDEAQRTQIMAGQRERLTRLLPDPWARDAKARTEVPSVAIVVNATALDSEGLRIALRALQPGGEIHLWLGESTQHLDAELLSHAGVHLGRPAPSELARIPIVLEGAAAARRWQQLRVRGLDDGAG